MYYNVHSLHSLFIHTGDLEGPSTSRVDALYVAAIGPGCELIV